MSMQNSAPGGKSMKFQNGLNPFTPFLSRPGEEMDAESQALVNNMEQRLQLNKGKSSDTNNNFQPGAQAAAQQQQQQMQMQQQQQQMQLQQQQQKQQQQQMKMQQQMMSPPGADKKKAKKDEDEDDDSFDDSDFEDDLDDEGALEAFRARRLAELQQAHKKESEQKAKGHGEFRTISQDEFLPECTSSLWVVVHFFHKDFERCNIMDHHLKRIAPLHLTCKFVRIDAEKAPFFVEKLKIQTLPTLLIFLDGKTVHRLTGFDGLEDFMDVGRSKRMNNPDEFTTAALGRYLEGTGCLEYEGPEDDADDINDGGGGARKTVRKGLMQSRLQAYDEDF
ncbi:unnamed protein product [Cylindrotheca closterium]|uniref:Thioredoxin domain-containing protein n=1 Tax=Cylindrotheca closterium TaxID=2856 RepID=A0AAD2FVQ0_9STRA|nr:unnamed protein product [Cylindrotheca closterium]